MAKSRHPRKHRSQNRQEVILLLVVCAVALVATLSVFIPELRHMWVNLAQGLIF